MTPEEKHDKRMFYVQQADRFALWNASAIIHAAHGGDIETAVDEAIELARTVDERLAAEPKITRDMKERSAIYASYAAQEPLNE